MKARSTGRSIARLWRDKRRSRRRSTIGALNLAPMMDVMFNLLIFFLVATSFKLPEALLAVRVPQTAGIAQQAAVPLVPIRIYLEPATDGGGEVIRVSSAAYADATTLMIVEDFDQLYSHLERLSTQAGVTDQTPVVIAARDRTVWDQVVNAYNTAVRARYKQVVFAGWR